MKWVAATLLAFAMGNTATGADRTPLTNYVLRCVGCHLPDGTGLPGAGIPNFVDQVGVFAVLPEGRAYLMHVPGVIGSSLSDSEIADLMNYMMETWAGPSLPVDFVPFSTSEVATLRAENIGNVVKYRRETVAPLLAPMGLELPDYPWP